MRIAIATVQMPFVQGGAELLARGLRDVCRQAGHEVDIISMPFRYGPDEAIRRNMDAWAQEDFTQLNGYTPDRVICLKFPAYYLQHPDKRLWLLHQHRIVYDLWAQNCGVSKSLKNQIHREDTACLATISHRYTIAQNVCDRLARFNDLSSQPLYHPPFQAEKYYTRKAMPYIFYPSRLEQLKRQDLLIEAMRHVRSPIKALIAGVGGQMPYYEQLISQYDLTDKVRLLGAVDMAELQALYANCLGVFFGPLDEDYGYVTLEAMLAAKPVITCTDSGGPLEFIRHGETGIIVEPDPLQVAEAVEQLAQARGTADQMGRAGRERYRHMNIAWENVLDTLLKS